MSKIYTLIALKHIYESFTFASTRDFTFPHILQDDRRHNCSSRFPQHPQYLQHLQHPQHHVYLYIIYPCMFSCFSTFIWDLFPPPYIRSFRRDRKARHEYALFVTVLETSVASAMYRCTSRSSTW